CGCWRSWWRRRCAEPQADASATMRVKSRLDTMPASFAVSTAGERWSRACAALHRERGVRLRDEGGVGLVAVGVGHRLAEAALEAELPHHVGARHDAHELSALHHRHRADAPAEQLALEVGERLVGPDRLHLLLHDVGDAALHDT